MPYDVVGFGETMLRLSSPNGGRLEDCNALNVHVAGAESNVLACASRMGLRCAWLSALPDNPLGRRVAGELRRHAVDVERVVWADGAAKLGVFYAEELPAPMGTQVYYDRGGSAFAILDTDLLDLSVLDGAKMLHMTGITPPLGPGAKEAFLLFLRRAKDLRISISFDVNYRAKLWSTDEAAAGIEEACRAASLLTCSRDDASALWHFTGNPEAVLGQMSQRFGSEKTLVLTMGSEGAAELRSGEYDKASTFPSEGTIRFGSGDAFAAGYLYAYLGGPGSIEAQEELSATPLLFGNAVASLKRGIPGDIATVTPEEVLEVLRGKRARFR